MIKLFTGGSNWPADKEGEKRFQQLLILGLPAWRTSYRIHMSLGEQTSKSPLYRPWSWSMSLPPLLSTSSQLNILRFLGVVNVSVHLSLVGCHRIWLYHVSIFSLNLPNLDKGSSIFYCILSIHFRISVLRHPSGKCPHTRLEWHSLQHDPSTLKGELHLSFVNREKLMNLRDKLSSRILSPQRPISLTWLTAAGSGSALTSYHHLSDMTPCNHLLPRHRYIKWAPRSCYRIPSVKMFVNLAISHSEIILLLLIYATRPSPVASGSGSASGSGTSPQSQTSIHLQCNFNSS